MPADDRAELAMLLLQAVLLRRDISWRPLLQRLQDSSAAIAPLQHHMPIIQAARKRCEECSRRLNTQHCKWVPLVLKLPCQGVQAY